MKEKSQRLSWHGMLLFLLGLVTGLVMQLFSNPRMGLAAHLEGLMNGIFLLALAANWSRLRLSAGAEKWALGAVLYGTYANWFFTSLAAAFGTAAMAPLAAGAHRGQPWQELVISVGFASVGVTMLLGVSLFLWGLRGSGKTE
ncbi:MAG: hydrogenase [Acidobacteriota bacterium]